MGDQLTPANRKPNERRSGPRQQSPYLPPPYLPPPYSVGEFKLAIHQILDEFREQPDTEEPVTVGRHRRVEAVVLSPTEYKRLKAIADNIADDQADGDTAV